MSKNECTNRLLIIGLKRRECYNLSCVDHELEQVDCCCLFYFCKINSSVRRWECRTNFNTLYAIPKIAQCFEVDYPTQC